MLARQWQARESSSKQLTVGLARNLREVRAAQRLRYRIFAEEMGALVPGREQRIDCDAYDAFCDHLVVRDLAANEVVGTYRILTGVKAQRLGRFYSDEEFDLTRLDRLRLATAEVGRSCVHPAYRDGAVISLLWSGLGAYVMRQGLRYLLGCASISLADGGGNAVGVYRRLAEAHLSPSEYRVFPRRRLALDDHGKGSDGEPPVLIKGYMRLGAYLCGAPAYDPDFNTADLLLLLPLANMKQRYARRYLKIGCQ